MLNKFIAPISPVYRPDIAPSAPLLAVFYRPFIAPISPHLLQTAEEIA